MAHTVDNQIFETALLIDANGLRENLQAEVRLVNEYVQNLFTILYVGKMATLLQEILESRTVSKYLNIIQRIWSVSKYPLP